MYLRDHHGCRGRCCAGEDLSVSPEKKIGWVVGLRPSQTVQKLEHLAQPTQVAYLNRGKGEMCSWMHLADTQASAWCDRLALEARQLMATPKMHADSRGEPEAGEPPLSCLRLQRIDKDGGGILVIVWALVLLRTAGFCVLWKRLAWK